MSSPDSVTRQSCDSVGPDLPFGKPARCLPHRVGPLNPAAGPFAEAYGAKS